MHNRRLSWLTCAIFCGLGCCTAIGPVDSEADAEVQERGEPDVSLLCEIRVGESTSLDVERILGATDRRETAESTTLLYQYTTGLTLSLLFRADLFVSAAVYNGRYPQCWADAEHSGRELTGQDAGTGD